MCSVFFLIKISQRKNSSHEKLFLIKNLAVKSHNKSNLIGILIFVTTLDLFNGTEKHVVSSLEFSLLTLAHHNLEYPYADLKNNSLIKIELEN